MLSRAEILIINNLITKICYMEPFDEMRHHTLVEINDIVPYDSASFYMASKSDDHILASPVGINISKAELQRYIDDYEDRDYTKWIFLSANNLVYRESDIFPDSARIKQPYYRDIYLNGNMYFSAQASIASNRMFQGVISLYRGRDKTDFTDRELFMLELLLVHYENRINYEMEVKKEDKLNSKTYMTQYEYMEKYGLTKREMEILGLLMAGLDQSIIADKLCISESTLKKHATSIYKKLNIKSRWELIKFANSQSHL